MAIVLVSVLLVGALAGRAAASDATASAAYEPNDSVASATGPLQGGVAYSGAIETLNDEDWFVFYTTGVTQLDISLLGLAPDNCLGTVVTLTDVAGEPIEQSYPADRNVTEHILYTAQKADTFYLSVTPYHIAPCAGPEVEYRLQVNSSVPLGLSPPPAFPTPVSGSGSQGAPTGTSDSQVRCSQARRRLVRLSGQMRRAKSEKQRQDIRPRLRSARRHVRIAC